MKYLTWALVASLTACASKDAGGERGAVAAASTVDIQVLSFSSWLGQVDPLVEVRGEAPFEYGGLAVLAAYFNAERARNPTTLLLHAADGFGASPPLSALLGDEPAIKGLGYLGVSADTLGNHNFNGGVARLRTQLTLASYPYVSTNLTGATAELGPAVVVPYHVVEVGTGGAGGKVKVALLGLTSAQAARHALPGAFGSIGIREPIAAANEAARDARAAGAQVVIALTQLDTTGVAAGGARGGPLMDFARGVSGVDLVLGHQAREPATTRIGDTMVVENRSKGRTYGRTRIRVEGGVVKEIESTLIEPLASAVTPDPGAEALLAPYRLRLDAELNKTVAVVATELKRDGAERLREVAIGDFIADALRERYAPSGAEIAVINGGGIRASLPSSYAPRDKSIRRTAEGYAAGPPYDLVAGDIFTVLPFGNVCVVQKVTGEMLWAALEHSVFLSPDPNTGFLQISGFRFTFKQSAPPGARVQEVVLADETKVTRDGNREYVLVSNNYLSAGGDGYVMLKPPSAPTGLEVMADVLLDYARRKGTIAPAGSGRITIVP